MGAVVVATVVALRGAVLGWGLALGVLGGGALIVSDQVQARREVWERVLGPCPLAPEDVDRLLIPFLALLLGVYAGVVGGGLLAGLEATGQIVLWLSGPVSRRTLLLGRWLGFGLASLGVVILAWLGVDLGSVLTGRLPGDLLAVVGLPAALLAQALFFGTLALALSQMLPGRQSAALATGLVLGASLPLGVLGSVAPDLALLTWLFPPAFSPGGAALAGRLDRLVGLLLATGVLLALAGWRFARRDLWPGDGWPGVAGRARREPGASDDGVAVAPDIFRAGGM